MTAHITYVEVVCDYFEAAEKAHEFTEYSAWADASAAHDALKAIRACIADELTKLRTVIRADGLYQVEIADAVEYATDAIGDCMKGPVGTLLSGMNAHLRGEAAAKAARSAEAA